MASALTRLVPLVSVMVSTLLAPGVWSRELTILNKCKYMVWPGILSNAGVEALSPSGFLLRPDESKTIEVTEKWGGRLWGRTFCGGGTTGGNFSCVTGDCGSGSMECKNMGAEPPATLAEFTLSGNGGLDFFDVSLVDGYNLPMLVAPQGGSGANCSSTGCVADLNSACPSQLKVTGGSDVSTGAGVACRSACDAFKTPQYCCSGAYNTPDTCKPSEYSQIFKNQCPQAYSYAYDDTSSTFTCASAPNYIITFCPSPNTSQKSSSSSPPATPSSLSSSSPPATPSSLSSSSLSPVQGSMIYEGGFDASSSARAMELSTVAGLVGIIVQLF